MSGAYSKKGNGLRKIDPKDRKIDQKIISKYNLQQ